MLVGACFAGGGDAPAQAQVPGAICHRLLAHLPACLQVTEPVAGNFYPITAAAAVTDGCLTFGVATDRCVGHTASLVPQILPAARLMQLAVAWPRECPASFGQH
jgi:hypothetical protein